ncbi:Planctomycete cytochrome C [Polystyrenella longa]|uniref:Planctomycete cytochrome C n=1 Tax=Polystyrenella longa TaxID=2528007 RepID=A0A518CSL2_9PLAN|nr:PSD1 and planctomycete cytochrome C domain-containing protein [Polystyrenella longa]QDU82213.1 Planctomycete cytochrome C [Polystyrenella longa]
MSFALRLVHYFSPRLTVLLTVGILAGLTPLQAEESPPEEVRFNRDIRPILSDTCFTCHGPSNKDVEAGLRFDNQESAFSELESGNRAIVPGNLEESELYQRVASDDEFMVMPPADHHKQLKPEQIDLLKRWIEQGAKWEDHWSFITPKKPEIPQNKQEGWARNDIDHFVLRRLEKEGLAPSAEADKETLIRRVTFDLTGLPPTLTEVDEFLADESPDAYEKVVDRLLNSPHYGEHQGRYWLDAARYGDTHGLHLDNQRSIWPYRDWVIDAFNNNMPFDQFTIEQIGGDLLPEPTLSQKVATGFQRCNVTTSEGGSINEEYIVRYAVDRVETMGTVWLGLTLGCAVCHEHKYDPITQTEFFELFAFYNSLTEKAMDGNAMLPPPAIRVPSADDEKHVAELRALIDKINTEKAQLYKDVSYTDPTPDAVATLPEMQETVVVDDEAPEDVTLLGAPEKEWHFVEGPDHPVYSGTKSLMRTGSGLSQQYYESDKSPLTIRQGDKFFFHVYLDPESPTEEVMLQVHTTTNTWGQRAYWGESKIDFGKEGTTERMRLGDLPAKGEWVRLEVPAGKIGLKEGDIVDGLAMSQYSGTVYWDKLGLLSYGDFKKEGFDSQRVWEQVELELQDSSTLPADLLAAIKTSPADRTPELATKISHYYLENFNPTTRAEFEAVKAKIAEKTKALTDYENNIPSTLIMQDMEEPRPAHILIRGEYDQLGDKVERGVPAVLPPLPEGMPRNRLALAKWLVDPNNPLTARVTVNRYWQQYFGVGLVKTTEDFGSQGEWPSHPELLDWLAVNFIESGWDVKAFQKLVVMSATYQQSSEVTAELHKRDPQNRLMARGPRFRLDAEMIRDNALRIGGLLNEQIGGSSVKPYQPPGLWKVVAYTSSNTSNFTKDEGLALYRRSMYTFWKRTSPPPSMTTFDAPSRETCTVKRERTNTPLQALNLLNDTQFVEAARKFAERILLEGGDSTSNRAGFGYRWATSRFPDEREIAILSELYETNLEEFKNDLTSAEQLLTVGDSLRDESLDQAELAAWTIVANTLLNMDETIVKE